LTEAGFQTPTETFTRNKGKSEAIPITGLFNWTGTVCYIKMPAGYSGGTTTHCCYDYDLEGVYDYCCFDDDLLPKNQSTNKVSNLAKSCMEKYGGFCHEKKPI
jgi:hypothetical protein